MKKEKKGKRKRGNRKEKSCISRKEKGAHPPAEKEPVSSRRGPIPFGRE